MRIKLSIFMLLALSAIANAANLTVTENLIVHLDAASLNGLQTGDTVSSWSDLAISDTLDGSLSSASNWALPIYKANAINGEPAVSFAGANLLASDSNLTIPNTANGLTVFVVATGDRSDAAAERALHFGQASGSPGQIVALDLSTNTTLNDGGSGLRFNNGKVLVKSGNPINSAFHIAAFKMAQNSTYASAEYYVDSLTRQSYNNTANTGNTINLLANSNILTLGAGVQNGSFTGGDAYTGDIAEVIIYNAQLNTAQMQSVYDYLNARYFTSSGDDTGLVIHLDAGTLAGLSDGDSVNNWPDIASDDSIPGDLYTYGNWAAPIYRRYGINGCPVVKLQGGDLLTSGTFSLPVDITGVTMFIVATGDDTYAGGQRVMQIGQASGSQSNVLGTDLSTSTTDADGGSGGRFNSGKSLVKANNPLTTGFHLIAMRMGQNSAYETLEYCVDDLTPEIFDNKANPATIFSLLTSNNSLTVGTGVGSTGDFMTSDNYHGEIAEIMIYNTLLDDQTMQDIFDSLHEKYFESPINISPNQAELTEGESVICNISLSTQPVSNVTLSLTESADHPQVAFDRSELTLTPENWNTAQTVTITAIDDILLENRYELTSVRVRATSTDPEYDHIVTQFNTTVIENECGRWSNLEGDYNEDCRVDMMDFAVIARFWLWCDPMKDDQCFNLD